MKKINRRSFLKATGMCAALGALTACGSSGEASSVTTDAVEVVDGKEMVGNMYVEGLPLVKEQMTFNLMSHYETRQTNFKEMDLFMNLEDETNVIINWELITVADWDQKKNLKLASGVYPDAFFAGIDDQDVTQYSRQFIVLNDLIDQFAPNIKAVFEKYPDFEASCKAIDGNIYSLSTVVVDPGAYNPDQLFINKTWLDNLGLPVPTTMDEFYDTLMAFKTEDVNKNGGTENIIPFSARQDNYIQGLHSLFGAYGRVDMGGRGLYSHFIVEDGNDEVVFTADKEEYRTAISELHKFFAAELFDKEIFTQDAKQYFAKGQTEEMTLGSFVLWNRGNMVGPDRVKDYVAVTPLKGPNGHQIWTKEVSGNAPSATFAITNQCKNPEVLVRWVDQFFAEKLSVAAAWGPITDDVPAIFEAAGTDQSFDDYRYQHAPIWGPLAVYEDYYDRVVEMPEMMIEKADIMAEYYEAYMTNSSLPPLKFSEEENDWFTTNGTDINNHINDHQARWLLQGGIDTEWDEYLAGLETLKIEEHKTNMNSAYQRYLGN